ncbi:Tyrosyl-DNA phosphodiesterase 1-like protein, partial [Drosera capensis]
MDEDSVSIMDGGGGVGKGNNYKRKRGVNALSVDGTVTSAWLHLRPLQCDCSSETIQLQPNRAYTIGRSNRHAHIVFRDPRVSKQHCQIVFDASLLRLYLLDGAFPLDSCCRHGRSCLIHEFRGRLIKYRDEDEESEQRVSSCKGLGFRASLNGVFANGFRIGKGLAMELSAGDVVTLACTNTSGLCTSRSPVGFTVKSIVIQEGAGRASQDVLSDSPRLFAPLSISKSSKRIFSLSANDSESFRSECDDSVGRAKTLLTCCRRILDSDDPISYIRRRIDPYSYLDDENVCNLLSSKIRGSCELKLPASGEPQAKTRMTCSRQRHSLCERLGDRISKSLGETEKSPVSTVIPRQEVTPSQASDDPLRSEGAGIILDNVLETKNPEVSTLNSVDSKNLSLPNNRGQSSCWNNVFGPPGQNFYLNRLVNMGHSASVLHKVVSLPELLHPVESITRMFTATFTSDVLWYPAFPEAIAFGKDCTKKGIACHHPKLLVVQREDSIRVIITSANLVSKQWNNVTNTVWWQDFPRADLPDYSSLFSQVHRKGSDCNPRADFASQLAGFIATLLVDVPSQAKWIDELTKYDFKRASGYLIASVPGVHSYRTCFVTELMQFYPTNISRSSSSGGRFLGSVQASVVGVRHLFRTRTDTKGAQLRKLAAFLGTPSHNACDMSEVVLRRNKNVPADSNAVTVLVPSLNNSSKEDCVQLGFLQRNVAKWVSPLWDIDFFIFSGYILPKEALAAAVGGTNEKVQLILHVSQGPNFQDMSKTMQPEHIVALCSLIASLERCTGLWRLEEVLDRYKWPDNLESDFIYSASSIGSSVSPEFLSTFSSAAGKRSTQSCDSDESDPEWGCWSASHELKSPSIRIVFPTINRVKNACNGVSTSKCILCFAERTWQRLKPLNIIHDAVPHPSDRIGQPMHVKVARRRFKSKVDGSSFGWVYCGSHNLSAAAWGRLISNSSGSQVNGSEKGKHATSKLQVCNYELGIIFIFPPPEPKSRSKEGLACLDDIVLPFVVPAPKYGVGDRPATKLAMREASAELAEQQKETLQGAISTMEEAMEEIPDEEDEHEDVEHVVQENEEEDAYAEILWSQ